MATRHDGSRSPVRAFNTAPRAGRPGAVHSPLSWSEATAYPAATFVAPSPGSVDLVCPDCGTAVRLALVADREAEHVSGGLRSAPSPAPLPDFEDAITGYKRELVRRALEENDGVMTRAAKALGLKYTTFVAMVHRLDADGSEPGDGAIADQR